MLICYPTFLRFRISAGRSALSLFLLGAGFNADAAGEVGSVYGNSIYEGRYQIDCGYPLVTDVAGLCFGLTQAPADRSIEELFSDAIERSDYAPLKMLSERLMEADFRLAAKLACSETSNCYSAFFETFQDAHFLTFNYDSLPEIVLFRKGRWNPHDGYGLPVEVELFPGSTAPVETSSSLVLRPGCDCDMTLPCQRQRRAL